MGRHSVAGAICLCVFIAAIETVGADTMVCPAEEMERCRESVLRWSNSLKSFKGTFAVTEQQLAEPGVSSEQVTTSEVEYRCQGDNLYYRFEMPGREPDMMDVVYYARLQGHVMHRADVLNTRTNQVVHSGSVGGKSWPVPNGASMSPRELFGERNGRTLQESLSTGTTTLLQISGRRVLWHRNGVRKRQYLARRTRACGRD